MKKAVLAAVLVIMGLGAKSQQVPVDFQDKHIGYYIGSVNSEGYPIGEIHITEPVSLQEYKAIKAYYKKYSVTTTPSIRQTLFMERQQLFLAANGIDSATINYNRIQYHNAPAAFHVQKAAQYHQASIFTGILTSLAVIALYNPAHQGYIENANEIGVVGILGSLTSLGLYIQGNYELEMASSKGMWNN